MDSFKFETFLKSETETYMDGKLLGIYDKKNNLHSSFLEKLLVCSLSSYPENSDYSTFQGHFIYLQIQHLFHFRSLNDVIFLHLTNNKYNPLIICIWLCHERNMKMTEIV